MKKKEGAKKTNNLGEVTLTYINAYTCTHYLFNGGLFTLHFFKVWLFFQIKVNACISIHLSVIIYFWEII